MKKRIYTKHGMTGTKIHEIWKEMNRRCRGTSQNSIDYYKRGIKVCSEWKSAKNFINWSLENGYRDGLQIDRIDNDGNYEPNNCRWVTPKENANNKKNTVKLVFNGEKKSLYQWSKETGINRHTLYTRMIRGWSSEKILKTKVKRKKQ